MDITKKLAAALDDVLRAAPGAHQINATNRALGVLAEYYAQERAQLVANLTDARAWWATLHSEENGRRMKAAMAALRTFDRARGMPTPELADDYDERHPPEPPTDFDVRR